MKAIWIRRIYHILLTAALVAAGGCLIWGCLNVYHSGGDQIYTLEKITSAFRAVAVPVYLALALVIGAFILELILPAQKKRKPEKDQALILKTLQSRANLDDCGDRKLRKSILRQRKLRKQLKIIGLSLLAASSLVFLVYALDGSNYHKSDFNGSMAKAAMVWAICLAVPFAFSVFAAYASRALVKQEIGLLKLVALGPKPPRNYKEENKKVMVIVRAGIITAAAALILVGALGGGWQDVLAKAAAICTECVGLG